MRIVRFRVQNFRNLRLAELDPVPNFMVVCGGNGCGKSALLEAIMTCKERAGAYGNFPFDPRAVSASAEVAVIELTLEFSDAEREFVKRRFNVECPETDDVVVEINKGGSARTTKRSQATYQLLSYFGSSLGSPGFFDYVHAYRESPKQALQTWDAGFLSEARTKETLARPQNKFALTKQYLAGLKMGDLQALQRSQRLNSEAPTDSLEPIREFFDEFFAPMKFDDVYLDQTPFAFVVETPLGEIDVDDLSSGEKEILNSFVRFHQLDPSGAVILFDEADAHLHPDLERRYLEVLKKIGRGNQVILTTHSPEMMVAAGTEALYTLLKHPPADGSNQLLRVTANEDLHSALSELMGSRGMVSFNQRIIFVEGEESSTDRAVYEHFYPPAQHNVSFVPAGNSATVRAAAERVNALLTESTAFQEYYSIVDGDIERSTDDPSGGTRLFYLPVYHVENFLLDAPAILTVSQEMLGSACPYESAEQVTEALKELAVSDPHLKAYAGAVLNAEIARLARNASDAVFQRSTPEAANIEFADVYNRSEEEMKSAVADGTWQQKVKGRDLLKAYCGLHGVKYEHFRNLVMNRVTGPPEGLQEIMIGILDISPIRPDETSGNADSDL